MSQAFYPQGNDYWGLNIAGWNEYEFLARNPTGFFADIFRSNYDHGYAGFFSSIDSYWNDLKNTLVGKLLAVCNIFSRGNYYINSLFFNCFGFLGHVALFRVFNNLYTNKKWPVIIGTFLLPSALYFSSGIHKDLLVFTFVGLFCYALYFSMRCLRPLYIFTILVSFIALILFRNFVAVALVPATIAWIACIKMRSRPIIIFTTVYLAAWLLVWSVQLIKPSFQPLRVIAQKQKDFFELPVATSQLETHHLEPTMKSFIVNAPQALNHSLLRPYLWEDKTVFLFPLALELFIYQLLFLLMLFFYNRNMRNRDPFNLFCIFFACSLLLFIGYIVPNTGSIVRYRSIYLPILFTPVLCLVDWQKIWSLFQIRNKNI